MSVWDRLAVFFLAGGLLAAVSLAIMWAGGLGRNGDSGDIAGEGAATPAALQASSPGAGVTATPTPAPTPLPGTPLTGPFELPILMYHHVAPALPADEFQARLTVTEDAFERELTYLKCAGYHGITMAQMFAAMNGAGPLPPRPIILTFDDGYDDAYTSAFPLLRQYGFPGSFAIVTGFIEAGGPFLTWAQIREMADAGEEMMSHTATHIDLGASDDATVQDQLASSRDTLQTRTGQPVDFFVYPSGEPFRSGSAEREQQVVAMLGQAGYRGALLAGPNSLTQDPAAPFALNRVRVSGGEDIYTFAGSIGGPDPDIAGC
ncbi:MAG: polysaccharide deacetylase family protein [Dehalococcoidia bacterium]|nr:polysaccharide deacetylase family protein [Dehalococcoidia bacterium]